MSESGKLCPACRRDVGIWAIFAAGMPNRIRCPHCAAQLRYDGALAIVALPFLAVIAGVLYVHEMAIDVGLPRPGVLAVVVALITWIPIELLLAVFLRERRTLRLAGRRADRSPGHGEPGGQDRR